MKKNTILATTIPATTIGLDLSDRTLQFCELNASGEIVGEGQCKLDRTTLRRYLAAKSAGTRVALETGGHSAWVRELIEEMGHEAVARHERGANRVQSEHGSDLREHVERSAYTEARAGKADSQGWRLDRC